MQAMGLGMCPVIIHTQEREFRLCFVTLRCGIGRSSQENHTCLQGNKLSNQNSESKASQPAFSSERLTTRWTMCSFLGTQFQKFDPWVGEWNLDDLLELSQPENSSSDHHASQLTFCFILFGDGVSLCSLGCPPTLHLLALARWALELQAWGTMMFFKNIFLKNKYTYAKLTCF